MSNVVLRISKYDAELLMRTVAENPLYYVDMTALVTIGDHLHGFKVENGNDTLDIAMSAEQLSALLDAIDRTDIGRLRGSIVMQGGQQC